MEVSFGKYKGKPVSELLADEKYVQWCKNQPSLMEKFGHYFDSSIPAKNVESKPLENVSQPKCDAYLLFESKMNDPCFIQGKVGEKFIELKRVESGQCPIGDEVHSKTNAYLVVNEKGYVYIGCAKKCLTDEQKKTKYIGKINK